MADVKITALAVLTAADPINDAIPIVDVSDITMAASGTTKRISVNNILGASGTATLASATITGDLTVDTSTLKVDSTNNRVGVGTATPSQPLHVKLDQNAYTFSRVDNQNASSGAYASLMLAASGNTWGIGVGSTAANSNALDFFLDAGGANSVKMTLNTAGNLAFPTGKGIDFSATTEGSGTMTSELLNDYEEGTWVGTLKGATTDPTIAVTATGKYTKIGRQVSVQISFLAVLTTGASGRIQVSGLPFSASASPSGNVASVLFDLIGTFTGSPAAYVGSTVLELYSSISNSSIAEVTHNTGAGRSLWINFTYTV